MCGNTMWISCRLVFLAQILFIFTSVLSLSHIFTYEGNSISKLQIQVATYVFEWSAGNCHR
jgi:hypothetical protein